MCTDFLLLQPGWTVFLSIPSATLINIHFLCINAMLCNPGLARSGQCISEAIDILSVNIVDYHIRLDKIRLGLFCNIFLTQYPKHVNCITCSPLNAQHHYVPNTTTFQPAQHKWNKSVLCSPHHETPHWTSFHFAHPHYHVMTIPLPHNTHLGTMRATYSAPTMPNAKEAGVRFNVEMMTVAPGAAS